MALLTVGGVSIPDPSKMTVHRMDLSTEESGRTLDGVMTKDVVARKTKISCGWATLSWAQVSTIMKAVETGIYMSVVYPDPYEGSYQTKTFYVGDRSAPAVWLADGHEYWDGLSVDFIEV